MKVIFPDNETSGLRKLARWRRSRTILACLSLRRFFCSNFYVFLHNINRLCNVYRFTKPIPSTHQAVHLQPLSYHQFLIFTLAHFNPNKSWNESNCLLSNYDEKILTLYVDIRIVCPAKTYSQLSTNSQCSGKETKWITDSKVFWANL